MAGHDFWPLIQQIFADLLGTLTVTIDGQNDVGERF